jgi:hypothetical protein
LQGKIRVSVVATGIDTPREQQGQPRLKVVGGEAHMTMPHMTMPHMAMPHAGMPAMQRDAGQQDPGQRDAGGQRDTGYMPAAVATATGPVPQLRATGSEQFAEEPTEFDAVSGPAMILEPMSTAHDNAPRRTEPVMSPMTEPMVTPRQQAAPRQHMGHSPAVPSPSAPSRTARTAASPLFASAQPMATMSQEAAPHAANTEPSRSLFGRVTGVLGFRHAAAPDVQAQAAAPAIEPASETARPTVRQTTAEDIGIGIPKFLLRQTSSAGASTRR